MPRWLHSFLSWGVLRLARSAGASVAVLASASGSSLLFLADGRADAAAGLLLGGTAAVAARWSAARLHRLPPALLLLLLRGLTALLALVSGWRALGLARAGVTAVAGWAAVQPG